MDFDDSFSPDQLLQTLRFHEAASATDASDGDLFFMSLTEAEETLERNRSNGRLYRKVARYVVDSANNVAGTADEYFNLMTTYLRAGDYPSTLLLAQDAIARYPYDVDVVAASIQAAYSCAEFETCRDYLERAQAIPRNRWNWRLFIFSIEYYQTYLSACDPGEADCVLESALGLAREYQRWFPLDERGYNKEAELLILSNRRSEAKQVLEKAIFGKKEREDGSVESMVAAQCCVTMLDDILGDSTDYEMVVKVAQRGIRNTTRAQPSANIGYFVYREALALDAVICDAEDVKDGFHNRARVREALAAYRCAYQLNKFRPGYRDTIEKRHAILCNKSDIYDIPLEGPIAEQ